MASLVSNNKILSTKTVVKKTKKSLIQNNITSLDMDNSRLILPEEIDKEIHFKVLGINYGK